MSSLNSVITMGYLETLTMGERTRLVRHFFVSRGVPIIPYTGDGYDTTATVTETE